jgi:serine/threonine-protein kinase
MADLTGQVLDGKYRLIRRLGSGGVGTVYAAVHVVIGTRVAIKIIKPEFAGNPTLGLRLVQEAKAASAVGHPSIIKIHDVGRTPEGLTFLVMELLDGEELADLIRRSGPFPDPDAAAITADVLDALAAAHARGIIHRDLKPENVFLVHGPRGQTWIKLLDFGIAKAVHQRLSAPRLTHAGTVVGTPFYMSPEQARGARDLDVRVDVYAAGVLLFEMLTRKVPFDGESYNEVLANVLNRPFPRPRDLNPRIGEGLEAVVLRAAAKDRDARFPTAVAFAQALAPFLPDRTPSGTYRLSTIAAGEEPPRETDAPVVEESVPTVVEDLPAMSGETRPPAPPSARGAAKDHAERSVSIRDGRSGPPAASTVVIRDAAPEPEPAGDVPGASLPSETPQVGGLIDGREFRRRVLVAVIGTLALVGAFSVVALLARTDSDGSDTPAGDPTGTVAAADPDAATGDGTSGDETPSPPGDDAAPPAPSPDAADPGGSDSGTPADAAPPDVAAPDVSAPEGPSPPSRVTVTVVGAPAGAKIVLDGEEVTNPFALEPSDAARRIRVTARGYDPAVRTFVADRDQEIDGRLRRAAGASGGADAGADTGRSQLLMPDPHLRPGGR